MSKARGRDTGIEVAFRKEIWRRGFRYRKNLRVEGVKADVVFTRARLVVFVDGCFWHGCPIHYTVPKSRVKFWADKLRTNVERDRLQILALERAGWRVIRIWEHDVKQDKQKAAEKVIRFLTTGYEPKAGHDWRVVSTSGTGSAASRLLEDLRSGASRINIGTAKETN
jgi:DNA mismatch endonuclease (patch repair protein)